MSHVEDFLTPNEEAEIVEAIRKAEQKTSGEIRVHIEAHTDQDPYKRAMEVFHLLKMDNTKEANGVLIYIAVDDKTFVIYGDKGINDVVPFDFGIPLKIKWYFILKQVNSKMESSLGLCRPARNFKFISLGAIKIKMNCPTMFLKEKYLRNRF